jgi:ribosomal protein S6--L-glutamate ligase
MSLRLGVATQGPTYERMQAPLAAAEITVVPLDSAGVTLSLSEPEVPAFDVGFVYPPRFGTAAVLDAVRAVPWVNDRATVARSRNKAATLAALADVVPVPPTVLAAAPRDREAVAAAADELGYPLVLKPTVATQGIGVTRVADRDALEGVLDYLDAIHRFPPTGEKSVLLQAFLPDATDIRVMVIDGTAVGAVERYGPGWKHNVHRGAAVRSVPVDGEIRTVAETVAQTLAIDYVGVDLLRSDGVVYCSETNARPTIDDPALYEGDLFARLIRLIRRVAG